MSEEEQDKIKFLAEVEATRFDYNAPNPYEPADLGFYSNGKRHDVAGRGMLGCFVGDEGSGKSFVIGQIAASHLSGGNECLNFDLKITGNMLFFDTEQSKFFYKANQKRIHETANVRTNLTKYRAYNLRRWDPKKRMEAIEHYIFKTENLSVVFIDGLVDIVEDYNDLKESKAALDKILSWCYDLDLLVIGVLHINKGDGKIRGHLGTEVKNKAEFTIKVSQPEENKYTITNLKGRYRKFPSMDFTRGEDAGLPIYTSGKEKLKLDF